MNVIVSGLTGNQGPARLDFSRSKVRSSVRVRLVRAVDDFALDPMTREESGDVYQLFVERNARASTMVTSNRDTADSLAVFDDALLAQSAIDRFKNNAYDVVVDGEFVSRVAQAGRRQRWFWRLVDQ